MGLAKRIGKSERLRGLLCWLVARYIGFVHATGRWRVVNEAVPDRFWREGRPFILAFWHGRLLFMPKIWRAGLPIHMLISQHRDGQLIARTVGYLGISTVSGSSTRGGAAAIRGLLKVLKAGGSIGITPDGPRGPRMRATNGVVELARLSGCPIVPAAFAARRRRVLRTWDLFEVALPFTEGVFVWGEPLEVPREADEAGIEAIRAEVERRITELTVAADAAMGHATCPPAGLQEEAAA